MAIVRMKKLSVMAMASDREKLMRQLLRLGCVEIREPDQKLADPEWNALLKRGTSDLLEKKSAAADVNSALGALQKYAPQKDGLFIQRKPVAESAFLGPEVMERAGEVTAGIQRRLGELSSLQTEEGQLSAKKNSLLPWQALELDLAEQGTSHVLFRLGVCPGGAETGQLRAELTESVAGELLEVGRDRQQVYLLLLCYRPEEETAMELLRRHGFSAVTFPGWKGTPKENLQALDDAIAQNRERQKALEKEIAENGGQRDLLRTYADRLTAEEELSADAQRLLTDGVIVFFDGWAPEESMPRVRQLLKDYHCAWEEADPAPEEYPEVPVKLKNNRITNALNMVTEMYSLPAYDNVDPNPLMAPFFILFYGIMMADMGYGLLMMLASVIINRKYRPKGTAGHLFSLLGLCGVSTFIMGALTGGFFGDFIPQLAKLLNPNTTLTALPALFTPLDDTLMILIGSMCLGFVQIVTGMAISLIRKCQKGQFMDALWEEVTWWVVFAGLALAVLGVTKLVLLVGGVMILVGAGWNAKGFGKVTAVFGSLYNHITGYFGDILSYSRLMALMLAGSVIAQVFNTLGSIPGNVVVFLIISMAGNALNFALNLLGCYVHDLRLQCLEYFNKFYEDGGKPFRPLAINTKYVDIQKN